MDPALYSSFPQMLCKKYSLSWNMYTISIWSVFFYHCDSCFLEVGLWGIEILNACVFRIKKILLFFQIIVPDSRLQFWVLDYSVSLYLRHKKMRATVLIGILESVFSSLWNRKNSSYSARHLNPTKSNWNGNLTDLVFRVFSHGFLLIATDCHGFSRFFTDFPRILTRSQQFSHRYSLITLFKKC